MEGPPHNTRERGRRASSPIGSRPQEARKLHARLAQVGPIGGADHFLRRGGVGDGVLRAAAHLHVHLGQNEAVQSSSWSDPWLLQACYKPPRAIEQAYWGRGHRTLCEQPFFLLHSVAFSTKGAFSSQRGVLLDTLPLAWQLTRQTNGRLHCELDA